VTTRTGEYPDLGRWVREIPSHCPNPTSAHPLDAGWTLNGWADCSCGGHRTVRCLHRTSDGAGACNSVHFLPRLRPACSCVRLPGPVVRQVARDHALTG
jgi:hypothetical protein